jgi:phosphatidylglycerophosphate synthase
MIAKTPLHPNYISVFGFLATIGAVGILIIIYPLDRLSTNIITGVALYTVFIFDKIDGDLARLKNLSTLRGAYLDSFLDRVEEVILLIAIAIATRFSATWLVGAAIAGPLLFYTHMFMFWYYSDEGTSFFPTSSLWKRQLKNFIAYNRAKFFLLLIALALIGHLEWSFYILPLLIPYTALLFLILVTRDKRLTAYRKQ